jgi:hypothetical protein
MSYDAKCEELATYFLSDVKSGDTLELAQTIQDAVEDYISGLEPVRHNHTCQQCDKVVTADCYCEKGNTYMTWCSSNCRAAYDL